MSKKRISFKINGELHTVGEELTSDVPLVDYIRQYAELRGTKYMCREAGCGACIVNAIKKPGDASVAVNSCMVSVFSCDNWEITTIEKVGNKKDGYHPLQTTLAENNGTQCGYCTPGFIMSMYSLLKSNPNITMEEIEKSLSSNLCRCTGYRPIIEAFRKFGSDAPPSEKKLLAIEDLYICKDNKKGCAGCKDWCFFSEDDLKTSDVIEIQLKDNKKWYQVEAVSDILSILAKQGTDSYMLVNGNTGKGVFPIDEYPRIIIDISRVSELKGYTLDQNLTVGAGTTQTELIEIFKTVSEADGFEYLTKLNEHIELIAHIPVRNLATIGGNMMLNNASGLVTTDLYVIFAAVGAELTIVDLHNVKTTVNLIDFMKTDMKGKVITRVTLPPLTASEYKFVSYKIMARAQASHAIGHSAYLYKLDSSNTVLDATIVYGTMSPSFIRATDTEKFLIGKHLFSNDTLQGALTILDSEMVVVSAPPEPSAEFKKKLGLSLFYKGLLSLAPEGTVANLYKSGANKLFNERGLSSYQQNYDTDTSLWPLNQPLPKVEALIQASGEAPYADDIPKLPREVFCTLVLSTVATGRIVSINPNRALKMRGVIAFYSANDIPGLNSFTPADFIFFARNEEVFCSGEIRYHSQPIGMIVAETQYIAERASRMVDVKYTCVKAPVTDIKIAKTDPARLTLFLNNPSTERGTDVTKTFTGEHTIYSQYHCPMETLVCVTKPIEEGLEVRLPTQWIDGAQLMISRALNLPENHVDVHCRRIGGSYGMKVTRGHQIAVACALAAQKLNRPVRFITPLRTNLLALGKRAPASTNYEVGVNASGVIQYLEYSLYGDNGYTINEALSTLGVGVYNNCYNPARWNYNCYDVTTDTAKNTWCRSPGTLENISMVETIMEKIAYTMELDPLDVRLANLDQTNYATDINEIVNTLKERSNYNARRQEVQTFNSQNRWRKRGLRPALLRWTPIGFSYLDITLDVFHGDGTIALSHGGIEMGQGINTKAVQICAYILGVDVSKVQIKECNSFVCPNNFISAASFTSQYAGIGVQRACEALLEKLAPIRQTLTNPTWETLIQTAYTSGVDLQTHAFVGTSDAYNAVIYGAALAEVEIDVLTGEHNIQRVDLIEDVGQSVSPEIDVGQIEGAFMMGLGYWLTEDIKLAEDGTVLNDRLWTYHPPTAKDIPQVFNVNFRQNSYSSALVLGSKMTGEPAICMSCCIPFALREAVTEARKDSGIPPTEWFEVDGPFNREMVFMNCQTKIEDFKFQ